MQTHLNQLLALPVPFGSLHDGGHHSRFCLWRNALSFVEKCLAVLGQGQPRGTRWWKSKVTSLICGVCTQSQEASRRGETLHSSHPDTVKQRDSQPRCFVGNHKENTHTSHGATDAKIDIFFILLLERSFGQQLVTWINDMQRDVNSLRTCLLYPADFFIFWKNIA